MGECLSIIIPAYNAERGLERAVCSVLSQTLRDLSVWIVDDGSTDGTAQIADELARRDQRVRVLHQHNSGAFGARVAALRRSQSDYFGFVDADDWVSPSYYEKMVCFARANHLDVVQSVAAVENTCVLHGRQAIMDNVITPWLIEGHGSSLVWDKIYSRKCASAQFDKEYRASLFEDMVMNFYFFECVEGFGQIKNAGYHYCPSADSSTRTFKDSYIHDFKEAIRQRKCWAQRVGLNGKSVANADWIVKNACNVVSLVVNDRGRAVQSQGAAVRALVGLEEVQVALRYCSDVVHRNRLIRINRWPFLFIMFTMMKGKVKHVVGKMFRRK